MKVLRVLLLALVGTCLLAACDEEKQGAQMGPDRTEGKMEEAKLSEFIPLFPAAPEGYTRGEQPGIYSGESDSTISFDYSNGTDSFLVVITFSNTIAQQTQDMMKDSAQLDAWGFQVVEIAGRQALSAKKRTIGHADFMVLVSNSRAVSVMPASDPAPDLAIEQKVFESIDLVAIGAKD